MASHHACSSCKACAPSALAKLPVAPSPLPAPSPRHQSPPSHLHQPHLYGNGGNNSKKPSILGRFPAPPVHCVYCYTASAESFHGSGAAGAPHSSVVLTPQPLSMDLPSISPPLELHLQHACSYRSPSMDNLHLQASDHHTLYPHAAPSGLSLDLIRRYGLEANVALGISLTGLGPPKTATSDGQQPVAICSSVTTVPSLYVKPPAVDVDAHYAEKYCYMRPVQYCATKCPANACSVGPNAACHLPSPGIVGDGQTCEVHPPINHAGKGCCVAATPAYSCSGALVAYPQLAPQCTMDSHACKASTSINVAQARSHPLALLEVTAAHKHSCLGAHLYSAHAPLLLQALPPVDNSAMYAIPKQENGNGWQNALFPQYAQSKAGSERAEMEYKKTKRDDGFWKAATYEKIENGSGRNGGNGDRGGYTNGRGRCRGRGRGRGREGAGRSSWGNESSGDGWANEGPFDQKVETGRNTAVRGRGGQQNKRSRNKGQAETCHTKTDK